MPRHPYVCYMLVGKKWEHSAKFYIGCTNNLPRRIKQHNGKLKSNNAKYTSKYRPWKVVATLRYCATQIEALQLEWAWQHPQKSRHLKAAYSRGDIPKARSVEHSLLAAAHLVKSQFYEKKNVRLYLHNVSDAVRTKIKAINEPSAKNQ